MTKTCIWIVALAPLLALQAAPANAACKWKNGEEYCSRTSDGPGEAYTDARKGPPKKHVEQRPPAKPSCKWKNGEQYCLRTSDGPGEAYTDARKDRMKAYLERRRQIAQHQREQDQASRARARRWTSIYYGRQ
jgi:hypothetical protein